MNDLMRFLLYLPPQASTVAGEIDALHYFVIISTMVGATGVALIAGYFIIRYRRRRPNEITPKVVIPIWLEGAFAAFLILLFISFWVLGYVQYIELRQPPEPAQTIYVEGKKWMWKFADEGGRSSVGEMVVPAGQPIRLVISSRDVIHSFYVPAFRIKQDALPGRATTAWFTADQPGTYAILCTEYCGTDHSRMVGRVHVLSPEDYASWVESGARITQTGEPATDPALDVLIPSEGTRPLAEIGESVATKYGCLSCHSVDGGARIGPTWRGMYGSVSQLTSGEEVVVDDGYITRSMMQPMVDIVVGYPPVMPTYQGRMEAGEVAAVIEYIRSLREPAASELPPTIPQVDVPLNMGASEPSAGTDQPER